MRTAIMLLTLAATTGCMLDAPTATSTSTASAPDSANPDSASTDTATSDSATLDTSALDSTAPSAETGSDSEADTIVIDVRSESEWESGHVSQAFHIPHTEIAERISEVTTDKAAKIVLYCAVGGRAGKAKTELEKLGYTNVENGGGYDDVKDRF
ncbi:MAG: rhodanese-like domain-containing protein [Pirellulaceae bacterium]